MTTTISLSWGGRQLTQEIKKAILDDLEKSARLYPSGFWYIVPKGLFVTEVITFIQETVNNIAPIKTAKEDARAILIAPIEKPWSKYL